MTEQTDERPFEGVRIVYEGETFEVPKFANSDVVKFERTYKIGAVALNDPERARTEHFMFLAYLTLRRLGAVDKSAKFEDVLDGIDDFDIVAPEEEQPAEDPTDPAP